MAGIAVFNVAGYLIEERRRWPVEKKSCLLRMWGPLELGGLGPGPQWPVVDPPLHVRGVSSEINV